MTRKTWWRSYRPHIAGGAFLAILAVPALWISLAYGGLPRLWSHHEHKKGKPLGETVSYTAQDIPGDPINLRIEAQQSAIECRLTKGGWEKADAVTAISAIGIVGSVLFGLRYPTAPVSPLYVHDRMQDVAYERDEGRSADRRHHVRFWQVFPGHWLASATFDRGVGLSLFTLQITHHIGPDVDAERDQIAKVLSAGGNAELKSIGSAVAGVRRNGGGDKYKTDGRVADVSISRAC